MVSVCLLYWSMPLGCCTIQEEKLLRALAEWSEAKEAGGLAGVVSDGLVEEAEEELRELYMEEDRKDMMEIGQLRGIGWTQEASASVRPHAPTENPTRR